MACPSLLNKRTEMAFMTGESAAPSPSSAYVAAAKARRGVSEMP